MTDRVTLQNMCSDRRKDIYGVRCTLYILSIQEMKWCIDYLTYLAGFSVPMLIYLLYGLSLLFVLFLFIKSELYYEDFGILLLSYFVCFLGYVLTNNAAKKYFENADITCIYFFFLPTAVMISKNIKKWDNLFTDKGCLWFSNFIIVISLLSKTSGHNEMNYMTFSYSLLPLWGVVLISALHYKNLTEWIFVLIGLVEGLIFGARGSTLWLIVCFIGVFFVEFKDNKRIKKNLIIVSCLLLMVSVFINYGLPLLLESDFASDSYFLRRLKDGSISDSSGRDSLTSAAYAELSRMGMDIHGVFYDRTVMPGHVYVHNFVLEILLDFGWIVGTAMIVLLFVFLASSFFGNSLNNQISVIFMISTLFMRYLVSGSIFDEGNFIVFIFSIASLIKCKPRIILDR